MLPVKQKKGNSLCILGIDEVGRGALAGPLVLAGLLIKKSFRIRQKKLGRLKDSKKLVKSRREAWSRYLTTHPQILWAKTRITPAVIDRINIARAADRAALRLVKKLVPDTRRFFVYLDGGINLPEYIPHRTIIKGDEKIKAIAAASIIAKVSRDCAMIRLHKKDPRYRFDIHKGYGTKLHRSLIRKFGYSPRHRKSFVIN